MSLSRSSVFDAIPLATVDAKGDLIVGTADGAVTRRAVGAADEVPVSDASEATGIAWKKIGNAMIALNAAIDVRKLGTIPTCKASFSSPTTVAVPTGTVHPIPFTSEQWDTDNIHDNVTNTTRFTCKTAGYYVVAGSGQYAPVSAGTYREIAFRLNGVTRFGLMLNPPTSTGIANLTVSDVVKLAVNDYVEFTADHDRGSDLNLVDGSMAIAYLGAV